MPEATKPKFDEATGLQYKLRSQNVAILTDTLNLETLGFHELDGTMLSPSAIINALPRTEIAYYVWVAAKKTFEEWQRGQLRVNRQQRAMDQFLFELGIGVSELVSGPHVTFVDPREHSDTRAMVDHAKRLYKMFKTREIRPENIVFSLPATEAGMMAARELNTKYNLNVNLYLVSSLIHAAACAETGAATVSIPIGQLLDWYERRRNAVYIDLRTHPGIEAVKTILAYFRLNNIKTKLIGTDFRKFAEIGLLGDFDAVCVSEYQIERLRWSTVPTSSVGDSSSSILRRAGQAQYPTNLLAAEGGFMKRLSSESRNLIKDIIDGGLKEIKQEMEKIEAAVLAEVDRQFKVGTTDLKALYEEGVPKKKTKETPPSLDKVLETRDVAEEDSTSEELLAIMRSILGAEYRDSDEVF